MELLLPLLGDQRRTLLQKPNQEKYRGWNSTTVLFSHWGKLTRLEQKNKQKACAAISFHCFL
jgi:hypothetical protein